MSDEEKKALVNEDLIDAILELTEENRKLKTILRAVGVLRNPNLEPVRVV